MGASVFREVQRCCDIPLPGLLKRAQRAASESDRRTASGRKASGLAKQMWPGLCHASHLPLPHEVPSQTQENCPTGFPARACFMLASARSCCLDVISSWGLFNAAASLYMDCSSKMLHFNEEPAVPPLNTARKASVGFSFSFFKKNLR